MLIYVVFNCIDFYFADSKPNGTNVNLLVAFANW